MHLDILRPNFTIFSSLLQSPVVFFDRANHMGSIFCLLHSIGLSSSTPTSCQPHVLEKVRTLTIYEEPNADWLDNYSFMCYNSLASRVSDHRLRIACINCATMAKQSLVRKPVLFFVTMVLLMALPPMVEAGEFGPGMRISFHNNMPRGIQHAVKTHCFDLINADRGFFWFEPTKWFDFWIASNNDRVHDYGGRKYWCEFRTLGKPITWIDVFVGTGGTRNLPCECVEEDCQWTISNEGISCGAVPNRYLHKWGQPR